MFNWLKTSHCFSWVSFLSGLGLWAVKHQVHHTPVQGRSKGTVQSRSHEVAWSGTTTSWISSISSLSILHQPYLHFSSFVKPFRGSLSIIHSAEMHHLLWVASDPKLYEPFFKFSKEHLHIFFLFLWIGLHTNSQRKPHYLLWNSPSKPCFHVFPTKT